MILIWRKSSLGLTIGLLCATVADMHQLPRLFCNLSAVLTILSTRKAELNSRQNRYRSAQPIARRNEHQDQGAALDISYRVPPFANLHQLYNISKVAHCGSA